MCRDERLRVLKQRIAEESRKVYMDGTSPVPDLIREVQKLCEHPEKVDYDDDGHIVCTCCSKVFSYRRA